MQNCENDKSDHQMRKKYFQFQRNEQSEIVSELHQCFWRGLSEVWEKTKITLCFTHIQEGWQEFSRKLVTSKIYFEAVTFPAAALRGSPHSSHNQVLLWDEQACLNWNRKAFSLAALEMILGDIFAKVTLMMEHPDRYMINIRVCLRAEFHSLRWGSHTICDSK